MASNVARVDIRIPRDEWLQLRQMLPTRRGRGARYGVANYFYQLHRLAFPHLQAGATLAELQVRTRKGP